MAVCDDKMSFLTQQEAQSTATTLNWRHGEQHNAYVCENCGAWHLTTLRT